MNGQIEQLRGHLSAGRVALFVGSDLPASLTGVPNRADLAAGLARLHGLSDSSAPLAAVAQRVSRDANRWAVTQYLVDALGAGYRRAAPIYGALAALDVNLVITTAYHDQFERELRARDQPFDRVLRPSQLGLRATDRPTLVKLYGDLTDPDTLVITEDDHYSLPNDPERKSLIDLVRVTLLQRVVLFVGYELSDPDFLLLWRDVLDRAGRMATGAYAIVPEVDEGTRQLWESRQIRIIEGDPARILAALAPGSDGERGVEFDRAGEVERARPLSPIRRRWALLVGVDRYVDPAIRDLKYCTNDVVAMERALTAAGFTVKTLRDSMSATEARDEHALPTRANLERVLEMLRQVAAPEDLLLFYFAGHGVSRNGRAYLLTRETAAINLEEQALPLAAVERRMRDGENRRLVLLLDCCYIGTGRALPDPDFVRVVHDQAEGIAVLAASTDMQQAQESEGLAHGVFTYYLLDGLRGGADRQQLGFVTVGNLHQHVLDALADWSVRNDQPIQQPTSRSEGLGDMILADYRTDTSSAPGQT